MIKRPDQVKKAPEQGDRVPPGQFLTKKFPVLTAGSTPKIDLAAWKLKVFGDVEQETEFDWQQFKALPWTTVEADFHCVTQWSALDNVWGGVLFSDLLDLVRPKPDARYVMAHCHGGYTTNLPLETLLQDGGVLAHTHNGKELDRSHGWPVRLVVLHRYGWKSAKWLNGIEFMAEDSPGFWERQGYHNNGDPWKEERFWPELS